MSIWSFLLKSHCSMYSESSFANRLFLCLVFGDKKEFWLLLTSGVDVSNRANVRLGEAVT